MWWFSAELPGTRTGKIGVDDSSSAKEQALRGQEGEEQPADGIRAE